ncbi:hypothetical protein Gotur_030522, partial [Gossypium turneri]
MPFFITFMFFLLYALLPIKIHLKGSSSSVGWVGILQPKPTYI